MSTTSVMTSSDEESSFMSIKSVKKSRKCIQKNRKRFFPGNTDVEYGAAATHPIKKRKTEAHSNKEGEEISKRVSDILASIYFDINHVCLVRNINQKAPEPSNTAFYRSQNDEAVFNLDKAVAHDIGEVSPSYRDPTHELPRLADFVKHLGWKMLAICAFSEGFRRASKHETNPVVWEALISRVRENYQSLEIFARTRSLDWRGPLIKYTNLGAHKLLQDLRPHQKLSDEHPHHYVIGHDGTIRRPMYEGRPQIHMEQNVFDPKKWGTMDTDPTRRRPIDGECNVCGTMGLCKCLINPLPGTLVELFERPGIGVAVRALAPFKAGDLLAQFTGEICPPDYIGDPVYSLCHSDKLDPRNVIATVSPKRFGNWTRFISHSCSSNSQFETRTVGRRNVMTVEAVTDIDAFEEITLDYGPSYWRDPDRECRCGAPNCVSLTGGDFQMGAGRQKDGSI